MIKRIGASNPLFKTVHFKSGINFVIAERTKASTDTQSTNGTGKSSLVEIIHFCFGADLDKLVTLRKQPLQTWEFFVEFSAGSRDFSVRRSIKQHRRVLVRGVTDLERVLFPTLKPDKGDSEVVEVSVDEWTTYLGTLLFDLDKRHRNTPTFRQLFRYFCRYGQAAFLRPQTTVPRERDVVAAKCWTYLLNLNWELLDKREQLEKRIEEYDRDRFAFKSLAATHELKGKTEAKLFSELFAAKTLAQRDLNELDQHLSRFEVLPEYETEQREADRLTALSQAVRKEIFSRSTLLQDYEQSLEVAVDIDPKEVIALYRSAQIELPNSVIKRLEQVQKFHQRLIADRHEELGRLIASLGKELSGLQTQLAEYDSKRAAILKRLEVSQALKDYSQIQARVIERRTQVAELERLSEMYDRINGASEAIEISKSELHRAFTQDEMEFRDHRASLIRRLAELSSELYDLEAKLLIQVQAPAKSLPKYSFEIQITHKGATGYERSEVFLFDMLAAQEWGPHKPNAHILVHDSLMFDPMDPRQVAHALELGRRQSKQFDFQYIVLLNESQLPTDDLSGLNHELDFEGEHKPFILTDSDTGGLFGFQFEDYESTREAVLDFEADDDRGLAHVTRSLELE